MKFDCENISIEDEEIGCTISFYENAENHDYENEKTVAEIIASIGQYIMLQRTYPEDEFEEDYYYFESSNFDKSGELIDFKIDVSRNQFSMSLGKESYEIHLKIGDQNFEKLKRILTKITNGRGHLNFMD